MHLHFHVTVMLTRALLLKSDCTCVGQTLVFQSTAIGPGATIWHGSALHCPSSLNEIHLLHSHFLNGNTSGTCNQGQIRAYALGVQGLHFRSQLVISEATAGMNGTTVECDYDDGVATHTIYSKEIVFTKGEVLQKVQCHV